MSFIRLIKYILGRALTLAVTIILGVFLTILIANRGGYIDQDVEREINQNIQSSLASGWLSDLTIEQQKPLIAQKTFTWEEQAGLHLAYLPRQFLWTINALRFDWPEVSDPTNFILRAYGSSSIRFRVTSILLQALPNTLLLVGAAYLILFAIGLPLALFLSRRYGNWLDRLMIAVAPISSIPSWVYGILLVMIFSIGLRILPTNRMYDMLPPENPWGYIPIVLKHMVLPVIAILMSLFFQSVYAWRTFFLIHTGEDYVELAKAKGLPSHLIERNYLLRPTLPFIITNFALTLVGFWQLTTALEYFFDWPGIGRAYISSLTRGETVVVVGIVVIFAYLLGFTVFLLDIIYSMVDPRVRIGSEPKIRISRTRINFLKGFLSRISHPQNSRIKEIPGLQEFDHRSARKLSNLIPSSKRLTDRKPPKPRITFQDWIVGLRKKVGSSGSLFREFIHYPSAVLGLVFIIIMVVIALYTVITIPYSKAVESWIPDSSVRVSVPVTAQPKWVNWFRKNPLPSTIIMKSQNLPTSKTVEPAGNGMQSIVITFSFEYPSGGYPENLMIYFDTTYKQKQPFVSLIWTTPDGRELKLGNMAIVQDKSYLLSRDIPQKLLSEDISHQSDPFSGKGGFPAVVVLFSDPTKPKYSPLAGTYILRIEGFTFDEGSNIDAQMVLPGKVFGWAGTDYLRRDLAIPLLWGLPSALAYGLLGAVITTLLSMIVAATAAWYGGWIDSLIQRITEANMILPVLAIALFVYFYYGVSLWLILAAIILLNVFGSTTKAYRAAFLQIKEAPYIEAARAYGSSNTRIIFRYLIPRMSPMLIPQMVALIPAYVFLEATLTILGLVGFYTPTWGRVIYDALLKGALQGNYYYILEPIILMILIAFSFASVGSALDRIINPRLRL